MNKLIKKAFVGTGIGMTILGACSFGDQTTLKGDAIAGLMLATGIGICAANKKTFSDMFPHDPNDDGLVTWKEIEDRERYERYKNRNRKSKNYRIS
jgi:hypothetical protein